MMTSTQMSTPWTPKPSVLRVSYELQEWLKGGSETANSTQLQNAGRWSHINWRQRHALRAVLSLIVLCLGSQNHGSFKEGL